jgi:hypothetical protein
MKKTFTLTIETDDKNIFEKYPNYRFNWDSPEDFILYLAESKEERYYYDIAGKKQSMWKLFGYRATVKELK